MTPEKDIDAFWTQLERCWDIEPRSYFEKEAPKNGFESPLAMAVFYMWKREAKPALSEPQANQIHRILDKFGDGVLSRPEMQGLLEAALGIALPRLRTTVWRIDTDPINRTEKTDEPLPSKD